MTVCRRSGGIQWGADWQCVGVRDGTGHWREDIRSAGNDSRAFGVIALKGKSEGYGYGEGCPRATC